MSPNSEPLLYQVLGVRRLATQTERDIARRGKARELHPDRNGGDGQAMALVNVAYETLSDPAAERKYLASLARTHYACPTCEGKGETYKQKGFKARETILCGGCGATGLVRKNER
ncbi:MAG: DnaJ domain-containing protein [Leptolyngbyaceae bacterium]|nr:DnaJ domain-containing protein [Leptolyngbyaceae bacterium]